MLCVVGQWAASAVRIGNIASYSSVEQAGYWSTKGFKCINHYFWPVIENKIAKTKST
jgi:hypothetical protein